MSEPTTAAWFFAVSKARATAAGSASLVRAAGTTSARATNSRALATVMADMKPPCGGEIQRLRAERARLVPDFCFAAVFFLPAAFFLLAVFFVAARLTGRLAARFL